MYFWLKLIDFGICAQKLVNKVVAILVDPISLLVPVFDLAFEASLYEILFHSLNVLPNIKIRTVWWNAFTQALIRLLHTGKL